jgi:hypothetical protein
MKDKERKYKLNKAEKNCLCKRHNHLCTGFQSTTITKTKLLELISDRSGIGGYKKLIYKTQLFSYLNLNVFEFEI